MSNTFGSLFAGIGGFDLGMESAGWECSWQVEWNKHCQSVLRKHWPDVPKYLDIRDVDGAKLKPVDCITFGSPCQDLSVAGKGQGLEGSRSGLFHEAIRIIKEMRDATNNEFPKWSIWENVPGALGSNKGKDFATVIDEMANIGALVIEWHVLDAQWFGLAQRRKRVYMLACYDSATARRCPEKILPVPEDSKGYIKQSRKKRKQAARTVTDGSSESVTDDRTGLMSFHLKQDPIHTYDITPCISAQNAIGVAISPEPFVKSKRAQSTEDDESWITNAVAPTLNAFDNTGESRSTVIIVDGTRVNDIRIYDDGIVPTLKHRMGTGGGQVPLVGIESPVLAYDGYNNALSENIYRTLRTGIDSGDHIAIPMTNELALRRLTPLECERLMGFPDDHTKYDDTGKVIADTNRYKMCGNAVASPVAKWVGEKIKNV